MLRDRRFTVLLVAALAVAVIAACSDDDPAEPGMSSCGALTFDDYLPTDEDGNATGAGGEGDWCWPTAGADPSKPYLYPAYPNPFYPTTTIRFALPEDAHLNLRVINDDCRLVRTLVDENLAFGEYTVVWNGQDEFGTAQPEGLYGVILTVGDFTCAGVIDMRVTE